MLTRTILYATPQQEDPAKKELQSLKGAWKLVAFETDRHVWERRGIEKEFDKNSPLLLLHIEGALVRLGEGDMAISLKFRKEGKPRKDTFHVNPAASPKRLDLSIGSEGGLFGGVFTYEGVYRHKDDQLEMCVAWTDQEQAPVDFTMKSDVSWRWRLVYERVKADR